MSNRLVPFPGTFDQREERTVMVPVARLVLRASAGPLRGQQFTFDGGPFVIGRAQNCTVSIPSQAVSRAHARIEYSNGGYWIIPEKTVNGTRLNGNLVNDPTQLSDKDKIAIDDSAFVVACRAPGEDLDFEDLAAPPAAQGSQGPQREQPRTAPPYGRDSITAMSPPAPARPSSQNLEPRFSAQVSMAQVSGQFESRPPERQSGPIQPPEMYRQSQPAFPPPRHSYPSLAYDPAYGAPPPYPYYPPPAPPQRARAGLWFLAGVVGLAVVIAVVVVTVKLVAPQAPPIASEPAKPAEPIVMKPTPPPAPAPAPAAVATAPAPTVAAPAPAPAPVKTEAPAPAPEPATATATLAIETTQITSELRGTVLDVARAGTALKQGGTVARVRMYSASFEAAAAKLASLQKKYGTAEEYADFIAEAKQDYANAAARREVKAITTDAAGSVATVKVRAGDELRPNQVVAEVAVARITVPVAAVEGTGKKCTAQLAPKKTVKGTLLPVGSSERTIELDAVPKDVPAGDLGDLKIHCP